MKGNQVYIGDRLAVTLDEGLDPKTRAYLEGVIAEVGEAGEVILPVRLYDMDELRRFERAANQLLKKMRTK
ncbi:MAG: hypothetical protein LBG22_06095 [Treponema sp.]|nr:hypothetical protein [Treponema sp.]